MTVHLILAQFIYLIPKQTEHNRTQEPTIKCNRNKFFHHKFDAKVKMNLHSRAYKVNRIVFKQSRVFCICFFNWIGTTTIPNREVQFTFTYKCIMCQPIKVFGVHLRKSARFIDDMMIIIMFMHHRINKWNVVWMGKNAWPHLHCTPPPLRRRPPTSTQTFQQCTHSPQKHRQIIPNTKLIHLFYCYISARIEQRSSHANFSCSGGGSN